MIAHLHGLVIGLLVAGSGFVSLGRWHLLLSGLVEVRVGRSLDVLLALGLFLLRRHLIYLILHHHVLAVVVAASVNVCRFPVSIVQILQTELRVSRFLGGRLEGSLVHSLKCGEEVVHEDALAVGNGDTGSLLGCLLLLMHRWLDASCRCELLLRLLHIDTEARGRSVRFDAWRLQSAEVGADTFCGLGTRFLR